MNWYQVRVSKRIALKNCYPEVLLNFYVFYIDPGCRRFCLVLAKIVKTQFKKCEMKL
jgi:hypothetical protein